MIHDSIKQDNFTTEVQRIFTLQKKEQYNLAATTARQRIAKLKVLRKALLDTYNKEIREAMHSDLHKHGTEVELNEIVPTIAAINHAIAKLGQWMKDKRVTTPLALFGFSHGIKYEPKGVVLIISPWNFPVNLTFIPLVSALAAGNAVILKPSENTPATSAIMQKIVRDIFDEKEVALLQGGVPETTALLKLPFNHIFFTGAPSIGKIVMRAAAENLTSVCLELGGKSPCIVDSSANIQQAATRIAWSKCVNNGQICIAPDYVYVHQDKKDSFIKAYKAAVDKLYEGNTKTSGSYGRIVNQRHFQRLTSYLEDAIERGGKIEMGGEANADDLYLAPTVISGAGDEALIWKEEIFGPILPVRTFTELSEPLNFINAGEKPLAAYIYSKSKKNIARVSNETRSGAMVSNYSITHNVNPYLPFGGVNNSGIGKGNGHEGFKSFSNAKAIQKHWSGPLDSLKTFYPPYTSFKDKMAKFLSKWLA